MIFSGNKAHIIVFDSHFNSTIKSNFIGRL